MSYWCLTDSSAFLDTEQSWLSYYLSTPLMQLLLYYVGFTQGLTSSYHYGYLSRRKPHGPWYEGVARAGSMTGSFSLLYLFSS